MTTLRFPPEVPRWSAAREGDRLGEPEARRPRPTGPERRDVAPRQEFRTKGRACTGAPWASVLVAMIAAIGVPTPSTRAQLLTRAEASAFRETSRLADVEALVQELQRRSAQILVQNIAMSAEGRPVWMLILGDPPPATPTQARSSGKPVVFVEANIHAGEVEGKEALQMLARDILLGDLGHLLKQQTLLLVPVLNPDGNEKISPLNRRDQAGPEGGVGVRNNGQNLDLNRDFVKLESPEIRAVVRILTDWDPVLFVDIHTTNGSPHRHVVTYDVPHNPNGDSLIAEYLRNRLVPWLGREMDRRYRSPIIPYGNFRVPGRPDSGWVTYEALPRYGTNYVGLRNRFSLLIENYAYAPFEERVRGCYRLLVCLLEYTSVHGKEMQRIAEEADRRATVTSGRRSLGIEFRVLPYPQPLRLLSYGFVADTAADGRVRWRPTQDPQEYRVPYFGHFQSVRSVPVPQYYAFSEAVPEAVDVLLRHGITLLILQDTLRTTAERFLPDRIEPAGHLFQGHWLVHAVGHYDSTEVCLPPGTILVPVAQPLGILAAWLLEPESPDGLLVWNFFDRAMSPSEWNPKLAPYPVLKIHSEIRSATSLYRGKDRGWSGIGPARHAFRRKRKPHSEAGVRRPCLWAAQPEICEARWSRSPLAPDRLRKRMLL
ncbi:MAG: M14 family metallopeptidase [candidate division KSB1 bacterium]|nr:M14 family metallopeptidase [candidate division KSB1 bacterium]